MHQCISDKSFGRTFDAISTHFESIILCNQHKLTKNVSHCCRLKQHEDITCSFLDLTTWKLQTYMDGNRILGLINSYLSNDPNNPNPSQSTGSSNNNNNNNNSSMSSHRSGGRGRGNRPRHNRSGGGGYQNNQRNNQRNNNNNSNNNNNNSNSNNNSNRATVEVQGMPPKVGFGEWKSFVNNSTPKGTRWAQTDHKQGIWYLHCDNPNTAMTFVKCLNGKTYKGNQIKAVYNASRKGRDGSGRRTFDSSLQDNSKQQVFAELSKRYNAQKQCMFFFSFVFIFVHLF